jgi:Prenyltransferase and squalene oxidase repeat
MVDIAAAIGYVVARGDAVDRARLSWLRTGLVPGDDILSNVEVGQTRAGGWPAQEGTDIASVDATCFRLGELDDLGGLRRPAARRALDWLASRQRLDGSWEEDIALAATAPPWARPGDVEARFYLTASAAFWLVVGGGESGLYGSAEPAYSTQLQRAADFLRERLGGDGAWPGFLVSGWLAGAVLHKTDRFYEAARIFVTLTERVKSMSAADVAWLLAALRRVGVDSEDGLLVAARERLKETQRPDGSWPSDDAPALDVQTTLTAIRAVR